MIEFDSTDLLLRCDLVAFVDEYCRSMTLGEVREWFEEPFDGDSTDLNIP
ncbi:MAG TPA: hypothetical protein VIG51_11205 [Candidatus Baltobacteraceae bacterium]|jgi:hypothetical protein